MYRKGLDLLLAVIPAVCQQHAHVDFIVGGSGPYATKLDEMIVRNKVGIVLFKVTNCISYSLDELCILLVV